MARFRVQIPGLRTEPIAVVTTLIDEAKYPLDGAIAELFRLRGHVEINFRDIKTIFGLDVLRTQPPSMIEKAIHLQPIAYNLVRLFMLESACQHVTLSCLSFKGTVSALGVFAHLFASSSLQTAPRYEQLLLALASHPVPLRPNRSEPRPKVCQLMTKPRRLRYVFKFRRQH